MFFLSHPKRNNAQIRIHIYLPLVKAPYKYNTKRNINPKDWDFIKGRPKSLRGENGKRNRNLNILLNEYARAIGKIKDLYGQSLTKELLKTKLDEYFHVVVKIEDNTIQYHWNKYINEIKVSGKNDIKSIKHYQRIYNKLIHFRGKQKTELKDLNDDFFIQFIVFLRKEYNLNDNTLHRNLNYFKTFLNWCIRKGFEVPKDFKNINVQPYETDDIALTEADLDTLARLELDGKLELTRDLFLIGCYSGQRYSDYSVFEKDDIQGDMIIKRAEKTETNSFIPLHPKLIKLLDKYDWEIKTTSSQKFNQHIQSVCKMAGFNEIIKNTIYKGSQKEVIKKQRWEMIGSHTARRTFITIAAEKMMPDHIIMAITGIRDPKTLNKYKKVNKQSIKDSAFNVFS